MNGRKTIPRRIATVAGRSQQVGGDARAGRRIRRSVTPCAADQLIRPRAADQQIVQCIAGQRVIQARTVNALDAAEAGAGKADGHSGGSRTEIQHVEISAALGARGTGADHQRVIAAAAVKTVYPAARHQRIIARPPCKAARNGPPGQAVIEIRPDQALNIDQHIPGSIAALRRTTGKIDLHGRARQRISRAIQPRTAVQTVVARATLKGVIARAAQQRIHPTPGGEIIVQRIAGQAVIAVAGDRVFNVGAGANAGKHLCRCGHWQARHCSPTRQGYIQIVGQRRKVQPIRAAVAVKDVAPQPGRKTRLENLIGEMHHVIGPGRSTMHRQRHIQQTARRCAVVHHLDPPSAIGVFAAKRIGWEGPGQAGVGGITICEIVGRDIVQRDPGARRRDQIDIQLGKIGMQQGQGDFDIFGGQVNPGQGHVPPGDHRACGTSGNLGARDGAGRDACCQLIARHLRGCKQPPDLRHAHGGIDIKPTKAIIVGIMQPAIVPGGGAVDAPAKTLAVIGGARPKSRANIRADMMRRQRENALHIPPAQKAVALQHQGHGTRDLRGCRRGAAKEIGVAEIGPAAIGPTKAGFSGHIGGDDTITVILQMCRKQTADRQARKQSGIRQHIGQRLVDPGQSRYQKARTARHVGGDLCFVKTAIRHLNALGISPHNDGLARGDAGIGAGAGLGSGQRPCGNLLQRDARR